MAIDTSSDHIIVDGIKNGVQREVERAFDEHMKQLIKELERDKDTICAGIVLNIMKYVQMQTMQENVVITIRKIEQK